MTFLIVLIALALLGWAAQRFGTETVVGRDWERCAAPSLVSPRCSPLG